MHAGLDLQQARAPAAVAGAPQDVPCWALHPSAQPRLGSRLQLGPTPLQHRRAWLDVVHVPHDASPSLGLTGVRLCCRGEPGPSQLGSVGPAAEARAAQRSTWACSAQPHASRCEMLSSRPEALGSASACATMFVDDTSAPAPSAPSAAFQRALSLSEEPCSAAQQPAGDRAGPSTARAAPSWQQTQQQARRWAPLT